MVECCFTSTETVGSLGTGAQGGRLDFHTAPELCMEGGRGRDKREITYLSPHCLHQTDTSIKMGSDERHFNVLLIVRDKVTRQCSQTTTFAD